MSRVRFAAGENKTLSTYLADDLHVAISARVSAAQRGFNAFSFVAAMEPLPWKTAAMGMQAHRPLALWQCCTRYADNSIPIGATWVDYIPQVNDTIETYAGQGKWSFVIHFKTNDTFYRFNLLAMTQTNSKTGAVRRLRRCVVPAASRL